ncbi:MAG TPA: ribonuclease HII [Solimonas sp.]
MTLLTSFSAIAGVDEAGRGCLAGPVYAAAVILDAPIAGLRDSKQLSAARRERLFPEIQARARAWCIGRADAGEIDRINILQATFLAMRRAIEGLQVAPGLALVDGNQAPPLNCAVRTIIDGDALEPAIMAASILAKVARDRHLVELEQAYPGYGFAQHKGYGTVQHVAALRRLGPCAEHRMSFSPCAQASLLHEAAERGDVCA